MLSSMSKYRPWCSTGSVLPTHCCSCRRDQCSVRPPSRVWRDTLSEYRPLGSFSLKALKHKTSTSMGSGVRVHSTYTERMKYFTMWKRSEESKRENLQKILFISTSFLQLCVEYLHRICQHLLTLPIYAPCRIEDALRLVLEWDHDSMNQIQIEY